MIEQEDKLGETCREAQRLIRNDFKRLSYRVAVREMFLRHKMEMMIQDGT